MEDFKLGKDKDKVCMVCMSEPPFGLLLGEELETPGVRMTNEKTGAVVCNGPEEKEW